MKKDGAVRKLLFDLMKFRWSVKETLMRDYGYDAKSAAKAIALPIDGGATYVSMCHCECGMAIDDEWVFCPMCGGELIRDEAKTQTDYQKD